MSKREHTDSHEDYAEAWSPEPGGTIAGTVVSIDARDGGYGPCPIVTIATVEAFIAFHAFHSVAKNELAKLRPQVGEKLVIVYNGKRNSKSGRGSYHSYSVSMPDRPKTDFSWAKYGELDSDVPSDVPSDVNIPKGGDDAPF